MRLPRIAVFALVAVLAVSMVGGGFAGAATVKKFPTSVTINFVAGDAYHADKFKGKVKSRKKACRRHRKVTVLRKKPGPDAKYGSDFTNRKGKYVVTRGDATHARAGKYYAKAKKKVKVKSNGTKIVCKKGKSKTITVP
jgi:hypothetical protein